MGKSKRRAFFLSTIAVLAFALVSAILNLLVPYLLTGDIYAVVGNPERLSRPADWLALAAVLLVVLALQIAIGAYWLNRFFGERYFDRLAPLRWALFGALFSLFIKVPDWVLPGGWWIVKHTLQFASLFLAFFAARAVIPLKRAQEPAVRV